MLAMNNEYLDVFMPTKDTAEAAALSNSIMGFGFLAVILVGLWLTSGMPGFPDLSYKAHERWVKGFIAVMYSGLCALIVGGVISGTIYVTETNRIEDVRDNMEQNVAKKYDAKLITSRELPMAEDRDELHAVTLVFGEKGAENSSTQVYQIRFDKETNEPFISSADAPSPEELEQSATK